MEWTTPFIVYRLNKDPNGNCIINEIYHGPDFKEARRYMMYIAHQWDVLCKTPLHPKHSKKSNCAEYFCHKLTNKETATAEQAWLAYAKEFKFGPTFPGEQMYTQAELDKRSMKG